MKVNIVKDEAGKVVATFEDGVGGGPSIRPVLKPGHTVDQVEADETYEEDIAGFYQQHSR